MKKKLISILLTSVMTVGLLSACGSAHTDDNTKNSKTNTTEKTKELESSYFCGAGYRCAAMPYCREDKP